MTLEKRRPMIFIEESQRQYSRAISSPRCFDNEYTVSGRPSYSSSTGMYGGGLSNGRPKTVSLEAQTTLRIPRRRAASKTLNVLIMLSWNRRPFGNRPGAGIAARWTTASTPLYLIIDLGHRLEDLSHVLHVGLNEWTKVFPRRNNVHVDHGVPMFHQVAHDRSSELAAASGYDHTFHRHSLHPQNIRSR